MKRTVLYGIILVMSFLIAPFSSTSNAQNTTSTMPETHLMDVPFYEQMTDTTCSIASLEMIFDYYGPHVAQEEISSVAQTGPQEQGGGSAVHARRAGHFSHMSRARHDPELQGYTARQIGYAAFIYQWSTGGSVDVEETIADLKRLIYEDYPLLVITWYDEENDDGGATHARVLRGYDDASSTFTLRDPWMGPGKYQGPDIVVNQELFINRLWNVHGYRTAVITYPWKIDLSLETVGDRNFVLEAIVDYPCPDPFDNLEYYPAEDSRAVITLPVGLSTPDGENIDLETVFQGDVRRVSWNLTAEGHEIDGDVSVQATGIVTGYTASPKGTNYVYMDEIGGDASLHFYIDAVEDLEAPPDDDGEYDEEPLEDNTETEPADGSAETPEGRENENGDESGIMDDSEAEKDETLLFLGLFGENLVFPAIIAVIVLTVALRSRSKRNRRNSAVGNTVVIMKHDRRIG